MYPGVIHLDGEEKLTTYDGTQVLVERIFYAVCIWSVVAWLGAQDACLLYRNSGRTKSFICKDIYYHKIRIQHELIVVGLKVGPLTSQMNFIVIGTF